MYIAASLYSITMEIVMMTGIYRTRQSSSTDNLENAVTLVINDVTATLPAERTGG
jgi:hypothetical protein